MVDRPDRLVLGGGDRRMAPRDGDQQRWPRRPSSAASGGTGRVGRPSSIGIGSPFWPRRVGRPVDRSGVRLTTHAAVQAESEEQGPGRPRRLIVPRFGLEMPIKAVTVDPEGAMALPPRPREIGWYAYGPRPGGPGGSAVLGGHIDSRQYGVGPLVVLERLRRGDDIIVTTDAGTERFRVITVELISKQGLDVRRVFDRDGAPKLRIITCGGTYRRSQGGYQANVVVTALPR
jgi:sortase (surface protein transpeptidase)